MTLQETRAPSTAVERLTQFGGPDLDDLCDAAESAIDADGGFGWLSPPPREIMESYWRGVLLVPQRELFVARLDGTVERGLEGLYLDVRESQVRAIELYEAMGYVRWGTNPYYAQVEGRWLAGHFFHKLLQPAKR